MKLFQVPYRFNPYGESFSMMVGARSASEAACKVVRALPNALVFGYPVPMNAEVVRDCEEFA